MVIGVGKEIKTDEHRVGLQPFQVKELAESGHKLLIEDNAGADAGFSNELYERNGAEIVDKDTLYQKSEMILKVKCPLPEELKYLRDGQILFTYLHFDENIPPEKLTNIIDTGVTGLAYEWVSKGNSLPLLEPMSAITGILFATRSMELLAQYKGKIPGKYISTINPAKALIIGVGHIGTNALNVLLMNRVKVDIVDKNPETLDSRVARYMDAEFWNQNKNDVDIITFDQNKPEQAINEMTKRMHTYDIVLLCAVRRPDFPKEKCEYLITRSMIKKMENNSIFCDTTACDKDLAETAISSEKMDYIYFDEGVLHYNCDHIPSYVANSSTQALTAATFPYIKMLAEGFRPAVSKSKGLFESVMCYKKKLIHEYSAKKKGLAFTNLRELL